MMGTGFDEESLHVAAEGADFIGCDAGSTDPGPHYLGSGDTQVPRDAAARDTAAILAAALPHKIPVIIGSAGTAGGRPHLEWMLDVVRGLAAEKGWRFKLASIDTELAPERVSDAYREGKLSPLAGAPEVDEGTLSGAERIVAMIGAEPIQRALSMGADVVVTGRCSDTSIYAAVPLESGIPRAVAWHAGKTLECGAACVEQRLHPDSMVAELDEEGFSIYPPNPAMRCTPASVVSHSLYETSDPHRLAEPGGFLDTSGSSYTAIDDRAVRVSAGKFIPAEDYTVRLEGASRVGYRAIAIAGIRDPLVLRQLDHFLADVGKVIAHKVEQSLGVAADAYTLRWRVYGRDATLGRLETNGGELAHEVGLVIDVVAPRQALASEIVSIAWHTALHHPIPEYSGLISNLAFPYSPPGMDAGPVYRFCLNHVLAVEDPYAAFPVRMESV